MLEHTNSVAKAITEFQRAATALQRATRVEQTGEWGKPALRVAAIRRIVGTENPLTGKPHSASSAADIANEEPTLNAYLMKCTDAVIDRMAAETALTVARWSVELTIAEANRMADPITGIHT
jgi:hypothetical protein